jgi:Flp pilus assembly protein TadD
VNAACVAGVVALALAALGRVVAHPFVNLDDGLYVTANPVVRRGLTLPGIGYAFTTFNAANWHPLTWLSHMLDVQLFGMAPGWHHAMSLLLHLASSAALYLLLARLTGCAGRSFFVAGLFAVHPLHVESVAWVAERKDVLSALLFVLTLLLWRRYAGRPAPGRLAAATAVFALGLMAKPMLVTLPFVLLLLDWWPLGRLRRPADAVPLVREKLPLFALSAAGSVVTYVAQSSGHAIAAMAALPLRWRLANALVSYLRYLGKALWPADLAVFYPHPARSLPLWWGAAAGAALVLLTLAVLRRGRRAPWTVTGWLWYAGMLVPVIGFVQVGNQGMADRYMYLPLIGLGIAAAWGAVPLARRLALPAPALSAAAGAALLALAAGAFVQAGYWRDIPTLYRHATAVTRENWFAEANLANDDLREKRWGDAARRLREVTAHKGDIAEFHFNYGLALMNLGDYEGAAAAFGKALRVHPKYPEAELNLGTALLRLGRPVDAAVHQRQALALRPDYADALVNLGVTYEALGREAEAADLYRQAVEADPKSSGAHFSHGAALARQGRDGEAEREYRAAIAIDPKAEWAHNNLGNLLARQGKLEEAVAELRAAAAAAPEDREIRANLLRLEAEAARRR